MRRRFATTRRIRLVSITSGRGGVGLCQSWPQREVRSPSARRTNAAPRYARVAPRVLRSAALIIGHAWNDPSDTTARIRNVVLPARDQVNVTMGDCLARDCARIHADIESRNGGVGALNLGAG